MKTRKFLGKALSVLLSGAMLVGAIPAISVTASAEAYGYHTAAGYVSEWSYSFENGFDGTSWKSEDKDEDSYGWGVTLAPALSHCGDRVLVSESFYWIQETNEDVPLDPDNWLYSPEIQLAEDKDYKLTFNMCGWGNTFGVFVSKDINHTDYVQLGSDYTIPSDSDWHEYTIDLSEYAGYEIKLAFVHHNNSSSHNLYLDCVNISGKPKGYTRSGIYDFESVEFEGDEIIADVPKGFVAADRDGDGECWKVAKDEASAHSGECYLRSCKNDADVEMNNWLVLRKQSLADDKDHLLTFYVTDTYVSQSVDVYVHGNRCFDGLAPHSDLNGDRNPEYFSKVLTQNIDVTDNISG